MTKRKVKKLGLCLAGGGGKGAYQVGALRAIAEVGLTDKISAIAGSSVGAINGAVLLQNNPDLATYLWLTEIESEILKFDGAEWLGKFLNHMMAAPGRILGFLGTGKAPARWNGPGIFSREGLVHIFEEWLDFEKCSKSPVSLYATCASADRKSCTYFKVNGHSSGEIRQFLLASSAIPTVFRKEKVEDEHYIDGGIVDNLPVKPLYDEGCDLIITMGLWKKDRVARKNFPNARFVEVLPETDLGGPMGVFDFSQSSMKAYIRRGYEENIQLLRSVAGLYDIAPLRGSGRHFIQLDNM